MQTSRRLKLGGLIELVTGQLYEEEAIDGIIHELQALHGVRLSKSFDDNHLLLVCRNYQVPVSCGYVVQFSVQFRANRPNRRVLLLQNFSLEHKPDCLNPEEARFLKNRHILNQNHQAIIKLIKKRGEIGKPINSPTELLEIFCQQEKLSKNFLYEGIQSNELKRKLKKKFDNIIADARRKCRDFELPSDERIKNQDTNMNLINEAENEESFPKEMPEQLPYSGMRPLKKRIHKFSK